MRLRNHNSRQASLMHSSASARRARQVSRRRSQRESTRQYRSNSSTGPSVSSTNGKQRNREVAVTERVGSERAISTSGRNRSTHRSSSGTNFREAAICRYRLFRAGFPSTALPAAFGFRESAVGSSPGLRGG